MTSGPMVASPQAVPQIPASASRVDAVLAAARATARAYIHRPQHSRRHHAPHVLWPIGEHQAARHYQPLAGRQLLAARVLAGIGWGVALYLMIWGDPLAGGVLIAVWPWKRRPVPELEPIVESHTLGGTALAEQLRAELETNAPAELQDVDEDVDQYAPPTGAPEQIAREELARIISGRWPTTWSRSADAEHYRDIADRVIAAGWRHGDQLPALDPRELGPTLMRAFSSPARKPGLVGAHEMWRRTAETAIEYCSERWQLPSGLLKEQIPAQIVAVPEPWPYRQPLATGEIAAGLLAPAEIAALDAEADRRLAARDELARVLHGHTVLHGGGLPWDELHDLGRQHWLDLAAHVQAHYWREPAPQTSPGGGERVEASPGPSAVPAPGDPADRLQVGDPLPASWPVDGACCDAEHGRWYCTREPHRSGQHVAASRRTVMAVWPAEHDADDTRPLTVLGPCPRCGLGAVPELRICVWCEDEVGVRPPHEHALAAVADELIEDLARAMARRELEYAGISWESLHHSLREHYLTRVHEVIEAGWRPPAQDPATLVPAVAAVLAAHDQSVDDGSDGAGYPTTCRCGWDGEAIHHAEHAAEQLLGVRAVVA